MSITKPLRPVKKNGRSVDKDQKTISSFFLSKRTVNTNTAVSTSQFTTMSTTPEKPTIMRSNSVLGKAVNSNSGFDDLGSSDTSFDSPEINNFRNPMLLKSMELTRGITSQNTTMIDLTQDSGNEVVLEQLSPIKEARGRVELKRGHLNLLDYLNGGQAKKVPKITRSTTPRLTSPVRVSANIQLSEEQARVLQYVLKDKLNVFFTGSAGTGKSAVLRELVGNLQRIYGYQRVGIAASTGLAACNIGGQTLHKLLSIGLGTGSPLELAKKIKKNGAQVRKWQELKVLIIDEISMIDGKLFTKLDELGKILRNNQKPFGGIQIVCTGDFFQLPPVDRDGNAEFCFQSPAWKKVIQKTVLLKKVFRQSGDSELIDMLNALRHGELDNETAKRFYLLSRKIEYKDGLEPTELFPTREEVKRANYARLNQLPTTSVKYVAKDNVADPFLQKMLENLMCEKELELKEGAQVMYLKNYSETIVNGSIGTVMFFMTEALWTKVKELYGYLDASDTKLMEELKLLSTRIGTTFWDDISTRKYELLSYDRKARFTELCNIASQETMATALPVINFKTTNDENFLLRVEMEEFSVDSGRIPRGSFGGSAPEKLTRTQLPLLLSWALSIHKAQGQTIDRLKIDLRRIFEKGQVYVALSRARSKDRLEVHNFDPRRITTSQLVKDFYKSIEV